MLRLVQALLSCALIVSGLLLLILTGPIPSARADEFLSASRWQAMDQQARAAQIRRLAGLAGTDQAGNWRLRPSVTGIDYRDLYQMRLPAGRPGDTGSAPQAAAPTSVRRVAPPRVRLPWEE